MDENFFRVSMKGIVVKDGKILLARESNGIWEMLGGGLDHEEEPIDGLKREIKEETGLTVTWVSDGPKYFVTGKRITAPGYAACVVYEIKLKDLNFIPSDECQELRFFSPEEIEDLNAYTPIKKLGKLLKNG